MKKTFHFIISCDNKYEKKDSVCSTRMKKKIKEGLII